MIEIPGPDEYLSPSDAIRDAEEVRLRLRKLWRDDPTAAKEITEQLLADEDPVIQKIAHQIVNSYW